MVFVISFCGFCKTWSFAVSGFYNTGTCYYFDYIQKLQRFLWNVIFFFQTYLICHLIQKLADMCDGFSQFLKSNWPLAMLSITIFDRTAMFLQNHRANLYLEDIRSFINSQFFLSLLLQL